MCTDIVYYLPFCVCICYCLVILSSVCVYSGVYLVRVFVCYILFLTVINILLTT